MSGRVTRWLTLLLLVILASTPGWSTLTLVQSAFGNTTTTTCTISISAVGGGHLLVVWDGLFSAVGTSNSVSDGTNTYTHCSNCRASDGTGTISGDMWYVLSSTLTGGATTVTVTHSGNLSGFCYYAEYAFTAASVSVDASGSADDATGSATQLGVAMTLTGTNDVVVQGIVSGSGAPTINSIAAGGTASFTNPFIHPAPDRSAIAGAINTTDGSAPTWTMSASARAVVGAMAFKEAGGASPPVGRKKAQVF